MGGLYCFYRVYPRIFFGGSGDLVPRLVISRAKHLVLRAPIKVRIIFRGFEFTA